VLFEHQNIDTYMTPFISIHFLPFCFLQLACFENMHKK